MSVNKYQIEFSHGKDNLKDYMSFFRYLLYYNQQYLGPEKITFGPEMLDILEGEVFAQRIGLVMFKSIDESLDECTYTFEIKNDTDQVKSFYSGDLICDKIKPINENELLMRLPPKFNSTITINFKSGRGSEHARFSLIEGYRMDSKDNFKTRFQINNQTIDKTIENFKKLLNDESE